jgi:hypothetical protein
VTKSRCIVLLLTALLVLCRGLSAEAGFSHVYDFTNGSLKDKFGGPDIEVPPEFLGNLKDNGYYFYQANDSYPGPFLTSSVLANPGQYAIQVRFRLDASSLTWWHKLIDPWDLDPIDLGLYVFNGKLAYISPSGELYGIDSIPANTFVTLLVTRDATTKTFSAYLNGKLQLSFQDTNDYAVFHQKISFFTDDYNTKGGEGTTGFVDWIAVGDSYELVPAFSTSGIAVFSLLLMGSALFFMKRKNRIS